MKKGALIVIEMAVRALKNSCSLLTLSRHAYQPNIKQKIDRYPAVSVMLFPMFHRLSATVFRGDLM